MSDLSSSKLDFSMHPLVWLSVFFAAGIWFGKVAPSNWVTCLLIVLTSLTIAVCLFGRRMSAIFIALAFIGLGALQFSVVIRNPDGNQLKDLYDSAQIRSGDPVEVEGLLTRSPETLVGGKFIFIKAERISYKGKHFNFSGNVRLFTPIPDDVTDDEYKNLDLQYGSKILFACELKREDNYLNPGVGLQKEMLDQQGIDAVCNLKSPLLVDKLSDSTDLSLIAQIYRIRQTVIDKFRNTFDPSTSSVLIASLFGNKYFLDKRTAEVFREGGTFHVLVISGLHITFIGGILLLIVRIFTKNRIFQFAVACTVLWIYALAVGAEVPVIRATLMFTILLFPFVSNRRGTLFNSLGASVLILLVWRPEDLFSHSFHLTLVSVAAIITMAFPLIEKMRAIGAWSPTIENPFPPNVPSVLLRVCEMIYWRENVWKRDVARQIWAAELFKSPYLPSLARRGLQNSVRYLAEGLIVSIVVQIWLLPILIVYFNRISLFGVILNLWVGINLAVESFMAITAVTLKQFSDSLAAPFIEFTELLNWTLVSIPRILIDFDIASVRVPVYSGNFKAIYLVYFVPLIALTFLLNHWNPFRVGGLGRLTRIRLYCGRAFIFSLIIFGVFIIFHPFSAPFVDGRLKIDFLDVGQGDSALITFPNGETMLVDGGGRMNFNKTQVQNEDDEFAGDFEPDTRSIGEMVVSKFLWENGYSKVDYILATHADADHIQGLSDVAENFTIKKAFVGRTPNENEEFSKLYSVLTKRGIGIEIIGRGDIISIAGVKIEVLFPEHSRSAGALSGNNESIVLRLTYGNRKFLLTGDIEKETEKTLASASEIDADIVKVAHHGSRTSSIPEFVSATKAIYAIIPVGRRSAFGHPHNEVVERWRESGAKVLTTGERGTISISTDGIDLKVDTFLK